VDFTGSGKELVQTIPKDAAQNSALLRPTGICYAARAVLKVPQGHFLRGVLMLPTYTGVTEKGASFGCLHSGLLVLHFLVGLFRASLETLPHFFCLAPCSWPLASIGLSCCFFLKIMM